MSSHRSPALRLNPGGALAPAEIVGRDIHVQRIWRALERQSVLLTAERRMGKTSVLRKMAEEGRPGHVPILRSVQDVVSPSELVRHLLTDVQTHCPGVFHRSGSLGDLMGRAGVRKLGVSPVSVEFEPASPESWKDVIRGVLAALQEGQDERIVFLWDELPHMIANISNAAGPLAGREVLDFLRAQRETHSRVRMVFSGSLGLHHVVSGLRSAGGAWAPVNDMLHVDLPPLSSGDAGFLAAELLRNERVACRDPDAVAAIIATQVDAVPYYVHLTVQALIERGTDVEEADIEPLVDERLSDPLDRWQLLHNVDRLEDYYGAEAPVVKALLDAVAVSARPVRFVELTSLLAAALVPPPPDRIGELLDLLGKDHYLAFASDGSVSFRLELLRREWMARRRLGP